MSAHRFVARCSAVAAAATIASLGFSTATQAAAFPVRGRVPAVIKTITVGSRPDGIAVSPVTGEVYVVNSEFTTLSGGDSVSVINGWTNDVTSTLITGPGPAGIAFSPLTGTVYLVIAGDDEVAVLNGLTGQVIATVDVGDNPDAAVYSPLTNSVYVTNLGGNTVSVIG